jgi:hypothetical protein
MRKNQILASISLFGLVLLVSGCETMMRRDDGGKEQMVTMDQLPAAAKATLTREAGSGRIEEIDKLTERGKTVYEADVMLDGKKWEIAVREDGQLLRKMLDEETDDEDDKNEDDGKEDDDRK